MYLASFGKLTAQNDATDTENICNSGAQIECLPFDLLEIINAGEQPQQAAQQPTEQHWRNLRQVRANTKGACINAML